MKNREYEQEILEKLISKYNQRVAKSITTSKRIILKPSEIYKSYAVYNAEPSEKSTLEEAATILLQKEYIQVEYLKYSSDIEKMFLREDKLDAIYEYLRTEFQVIPKSALREQMQEVLQQFSSDFSTSKLTTIYAENIRIQLEDPRIQPEIERVKKNLQMLKFLESNKKKLYVREASMLVYGESKWFEENNYEEICTILRMAYQMPKQADERNDAILTNVLLFPLEQDIFIKGDWTIEWSDYVLETAGLSGGISISSTDISGITRMTLHAKRLLTVENKTSYQRMSGQSDAIMYLGGFANNHQILFLQKLIKDNTDVIYEHFGDIDIGGFLIHKHLCEATGHAFKLYKMGINQLQDVRFARCLQPLTDNDRVRLETLLPDRTYHATLSYMKEHNVKLEQEIISLLEE